MHFVTLTSDWNKDDFYTAAVKGVILSACEDTSVVTISNQIRHHRVSEAAFVLRNSYNKFPVGTVHIVAVSTRPEPASKLLAAKVNGHYFLTADNGILGLLGDTNESEVVELKEKSESYQGFPSLTVFAETACKIIKGKSLSSIGDLTDNYKKQVPLRATLENNNITGTVIYTDSYGNAITNISVELFERIGNEREFTIYVQSKHYKVSKLNKHYSETNPGDLLALFNSVDLLEIAIRNGSAKDLLNLSTDSTIRVEFNARKNE